MREWTGLQFSKSQGAMQNRKNREKWLKVICGVPTTHTVKDDDVDGDAFVSRLS